LVFEFYELFFLDFVFCFLSCSMKKLFFFAILLAALPAVSYSQILDTIDILEKDSIVKYAVQYESKDSIHLKKIVGKYAKFPKQKALVMHFRDSLRHGREIIYFPNKKKSIVKNFRKGKLQGIWKLYNEGGFLLAKGRYFNGHRNGLWTEYSNGKKIGSTTYLDGFQMRGQFLNHPIR
jgi:hypothetical protein